MQFPELSAGGAVAWPPEPGRAADAGCAGDVGGVLHLVAANGAELDAEILIVCHGRVGLGAPEVAVEIVVGAVEGVLKAVVCAGVDELAGEESAAGDEEVVAGSGDRVHLGVAVFVTQPDEGVVGGVSAERQHGVAAFDVAAGESVPVAVDKRDADGAGDRRAGGCGAVDVQLHEGAGVGGSG